MAVVFKVEYKVLLNGKEMNHDFVKKIVFTDEIDNSSDKVSIETTEEFERPNFGDELELWLGVDGELSYMGSFHVQGTTVTNRKLSFAATGANFSAQQKERKNRTWEQVKIADVVAKIATEHELDFKCTIDYFLSHEAQSHESDLAFLKRLAKENNATFSIKNKTILFLNKDEESKTTFSCNAKECISISIEQTNKRKYGKAKVSYRDNNNNENVTVTVGDGEGTLEIQKSFKSKEEAKKFANNKLKESNRGSTKGNFTIIFNTDPIAGGVVDISNSRYDDGEYNIKRVTHDVMGGVTRVEFEG